MYECAKFISKFSGPFRQDESSDGNDFLLIALSFLTGKDQRPTFDLCGGAYSSKAAAQVGSLPQGKAYFFAEAKDDIDFKLANIKEIDIPSFCPAYPLLAYRCDFSASAIVFDDTL